MSRPRKPARLWQRKDGAWIILDGGRQFRIGASGKCDRELAEKALAEHIAGKTPQRIGPAHPSEISLDEVLAKYIMDKGPGLAAPDRLAYAARRLGEFWSGKTCDAVKGSTCRAYLRHRQEPVFVPFRGGKKGRMVSASEPTVRRELNVLQAAMNYGLAEGLLVYAPTVTLPEKGAARERWLTRGEAARLLWAARQGRNKTLVRAILISLYTGTRIGAILRLRWVHSLDSGWVDFFKDKEEIHSSVVLIALERLSWLVDERVAARATATDRVDAFCRAHAEFLASDGDFYISAAMGYKSITDPEVKRKARALRTGYEQKLRDIIQAGIDAGEFRPLDTLLGARAIISCLNWMARWWKPGGPQGAEEIASAYAALIIRGFLPDR